MNKALISRVARKHMHKTSCGADCGCCKTSPVEVYSELGSLPIEVSLHRVDASDLHPEGESYMSVQALESMRDHAEELLQKIDSGTPLPDWVEAKLTRAALNLEDVYEYMAHGHGKKASRSLLPGQFHVERPNSRTVRLLVYPPGFSSFFEAPDNARAIPKLLGDLAAVGFTADEFELEEAIAQA